MNRKKFTVKDMNVSTKESDGGVGKKQRDLIMEELHIVHLSRTSTDIHDFGPSSETYVRFLYRERL